ncbi:MAG: hypothetical protein U0835_23655 [Isosphaeraceae bacterium]
MIARNPGAALAVMTLAAALGVAAAGCGTPPQIGATARRSTPSTRCSPPSR